MTGADRGTPAVGGSDSLTGGDASLYLLRPIVFQNPDRVVDPPSWLEHIPFAFWIVDALRPHTLVELGTHTGNSYAAFAQAVRMTQLPTACYAIDTWEGDPQSGFYGEDVFSEWRAYHDRHFSGFSRLIRARFADAVHHFADRTIDVLHIDGYHTLDAVQQDFETWLPKMSARGLMLLHDINVREADFGAWQLWERVQAVYPSFAFLHGHGLGVLGVGRDWPDPVRWLLTRGPGHSPDVVSVREFFWRAGRRISQLHEAVRGRNTALDALKAHAERDPDGIRSLAQQLDAATARAEQVQSELVRATEHLLELEARLGDESAGRVAATRELDTVREERDQLLARFEAERAAHASVAGQLDAEARALANALEQARPRRTRRPAPSPARTAGLPVPANQASRWRQIAGIARAAFPVMRMALSARTWRDAVRSAGQFAAHPGRIRTASLIARSGLFDASYYLEANADVAASGIPPLVHYVLCGGREGRRPSALVDPAFYLSTYPDVARSGLDPLTHFLLHGGFEERNPGPDFDTRYYLASNPDVRATGVNPLVHFVTIGWREGRNPSASFDCQAYLERYEDVRASGRNPLAQFVESGRAEGRDASPMRNAPLVAPVRVRLSARPLSKRGPQAPLVVCVSHVSPWPPHAGNAYRVYGLLAELQRRGFRIVPVIAPLPGESPDAAAVQAVARQFSNVVIVERDGQLRYELTDVPDVLGSLDAEYTPRYSAVLGEEVPLSARDRELLVHERTYCHDAVIAAILRLHHALDHYVLLTEYVWMTRLLPLIDDRAVKVVDTIDVFSTKPAKVLRFGIQDLWMEPGEEAARLKRADLVVAIQDDERRALQHLVPDRQVVTAGIDFEVSGVARLPDAPRLLYVGSANPLNVRGLRDFLRFAWPIVKQQVPDAELIVAGAVAESVREPLPGVKLLGSVERLDGLYASCRVAINPAIAGTGLKIKSVESLCRLRPLVTWPAGVDGLPTELRPLCDVAEDWYDFGVRVVRRLVTRGGDAFSEAERRAIEQSTSSQAVYAALVGALQQRLAQHASAAGPRSGT